MNIYLDDIRGCPKPDPKGEGVWMDCGTNLDLPDGPIAWHVVRSVARCIKMLQEYQGQVDILSLDHDLGNVTHNVGLGIGLQEESTGYDILTWLEKQVVVYGNAAVLPKRFRIHSANPVGRKRMKAAIESINRRLE